MDSESRVAIITGASTGLGKEFAIQLAAQGYRVGLLARREGELQTICSVIRNSGKMASYRTVDISKRADTLAGIQSLIQEFGKVDLLIANAGVGTGNPPGNLNVTGAEKLIQINLMGVYYSIEAVLERMLQQKSGQIVAISSLAAYKGMPGAAAYSASKAAVNTLMESLRIQYYGQGVCFTTICPGFIRTQMTQKNRKMFLLMNPDQAVKIMIRAIERKKKIVNFPWLTYRLMRLTYWVPDWILHRVLPDEVGGQGA